MVSPPPASTKPGRAYHHGDLRNALIEAGLAALEAQDASELSLRALARDLGVSANAAYRHFADKDALLSALAAEGFRRFAQAQRAARVESGTNPVATGLDYIRFAQHHPGLFRLMFGRFTRACDNAELQDAALLAFQQLLEDSRPVQPGSTPATGGPATDSPAIDEATLLRAIARWSLVHGLSHLMLEGQLSFFGAGTFSEQLASRVLMASGLGSAPAQPLGKPSTKASN